MSQATGTIPAAMLARLTRDQLDGAACVRCGEIPAQTVPIAVAEGRIRLECAKKSGCTVISWEIWHEARALNDRRDFIAGWRALLDLLERNLDLPLPVDDKVMFTFWGTDARSELANAARQIPVRLNKRVYGGPNDDQYFELSGKLNGLPIRLVADRESVCTRRVVGTREVTETVPDPEKLAKVPEITRSRTEEIVEWDCGPLLAGDRS